MDTSTLQKIKELAEEYRKGFTRTQRGEETIWTLTEEARNAPRVFTHTQELVAATHEDRNMAPDDYRYEWTVDALDAIAEAIEYDQDLEDREFEIEPDVYTHDLVKWLGSSAWRYSYCNEALSALGSNDGGFVGLMMYGQEMEKREVYRAVLEFLTERAEELEDEEDED